MSPVRILIHLAPAKRSNERDLFTLLDDTVLRTIGGDDEHTAPDIALPVRRLPWLGSRERWSAALAWLRSTDEVVAEVDAVVAQEAYSVGSAQMARLARRLGVPLIVLVAEILDDYPLYRLPPWRFFTRAVRASDAHYVCLTELARRHLIAKGFDEHSIDVVAPGVDTSLFHPAEGGRSPGRVVTFVGELRPDKGIVDLVDAGDILAAAGRPIDLRVIGDGPLVGRLRDQAASRPWLHLEGRVPRSDVAAALRECTVFCLPSRGRRLWAEQFGFALVEAMASGVPVVSTDCGAIPMVVPAWNPLVAQGDAAALAQGLEAAIGPDGADWGRRNRDWAVEHFDLPIQAAQLRGVLDGVLARRHPKG